MNTQQESSELFTLSGNDPSMWLEQARWLKASAEVIRIEINRVYALNLSPSDRSDVLLGLIQSCMLLTSFCFENLIKGIIATRNPDKMIIDGKLNTSLWPGNGHKLTRMLPPDIIPTTEELELLTRLEVYGLWGGRYPVPTGSIGFHTDRSNLAYKAIDSTTVNQLFARLYSHVSA